MARWEEALDAKLDLYLFTQSERGQRYIEGWMKAEIEGGHLAVARDEPMSQRVATVAFLADPVWVDPDMQTLWEAAVPSFQPETMQAPDLITDAGFCYLPTPHFTRDIHGRRTSFRAFAWATTMLDWRSSSSDDPWEANFPGMLLFMFHRLGDVDDYDNGRASIGYNADGTTSVIPYNVAQLRTGDLILDFVYPWPFGSRVDEDGVRRMPLRRASGRDVYEVDPNGTTGIVGRAETFGKRVDTVGPENIEKHVQCLFRLMQQTIATRTQYDPTRPVRRRFEKAKVDARKITVIQLRRPNTPASGGDKRHVEWSHRWLVAGHWRNQWYPTLQLHRQIWISPYVKGPDEMPLDVRKERVFELVR